APNCANASIGTLAVGASAEYDCTLANVQTDFTNTANASGHPPVGTDVTASDTADVDVIHPAITIAKDPASQKINSGDTASFGITVTTPGDVPLTGVHVRAALSPDCPRTAAQIAATPPHSSSTFAPGDSVSYTCTKATVTSSFTNSATATGTP